MSKSGLLDYIQQLHGEIQNRGGWSKDLFMAQYHARNGQTRAAEEQLAVHLRSLSPEPKAYTHTCDSLPGSVCVACEAEEPKVEPGEGPTDEELRYRFRPVFAVTNIVTIRRLVEFGIDWERARQKSRPPGALELTGEELRALNLCVGGSRGGTNRVIAGEALRKLNARAGSEGAKAETEEDERPVGLPRFCRHCGGRNDDFGNCEMQCKGWKEETGYYGPTPPAASETAKCSCVVGSHGTRLGVATCPMHGTGARPSPEAIPTAWMRRIGEEIYSIVTEGDPSSRPARLGQRVCTEIAVALVTRLGIVEPAPTISKMETVGEGEASETDSDEAGAGRMYDLICKLESAPPGTGWSERTPWHQLTGPARENCIAAYRFVRAESEARVREISKERDQWMGTALGLESANRSLHASKATLKVGKEAAEQRARENGEKMVQALDERDGAQRLYEENYVAKEAAEARVAAVEKDRARLGQLFGAALQRLQELGESTFDLDRAQSPESGGAGGK